MAVYKCESPIKVFQLLIDATVCEPAGPMLPIIQKLVAVLLNKHLAGPIAHTFESYIYMRWHPL